MAGLGIVYGGLLVAPPYVTYTVQSKGNDEATDRLGVDTQANIQLPVQTWLDTKFQEFAEAKRRRDLK